MYTILHGNKYAIGAMQEIGILPSTSERIGYDLGLFNTCKALYLASDGTVFIHQTSASALEDVLLPVSASEAKHFLSVDEHAYEKVFGQVKEIK